MSLLIELCSAPISKRDLEWEKSLSKAFFESPVYLVDDQPFQGPDGFSYMQVSSEKGAEINKEDFLNWCFESGLGIVLNLKEKKSPDFVFNYGMVWNYLLRGSFVNEVPEDLNLDEPKETYIHEISEGYLPKQVRGIIKSFLEMNKVTKVSLSLISGGDKTPYELIWFFPELQDLPEGEQSALLEAVSWFLPLDYRLAWAEASDEELRFQSL